MGTLPPSNTSGLPEAGRERLLSSLLDTVAAVLLVFDRDGELCFLNGAAQEACRGVLGGAHPQAVELLKEEGGPDARSTLERMRRGEQPSPFASTWQVAGERRHVEWTYQRLFDAAGAPEFVVCSGLDVTEKRRSQEALRGQVHFLQTLIDTLPNPLFYKTVDGLYRGCNRAFEEMLGVGREQIVGKTVYDLSPRELAEVYFRKDRELFENPGVQVYESSVRYANGQTRECIYYKATYRDLSGEVAGLVGIFLDITDRKRAERELERARDELEVRVQERTAELEREKDRAEAADRAKSEFLNIASHELRTPLTTLRLTMHQLSSDLSRGLQVELRHLGRMDRQIARLSRMVTDLLDVSRLERGTLRIRPVELDLKQLVTEAVEELRPLSLERLLAPSLPAEAARVSADPDRIRQVLSNLVDNALKYTPADARVQVSLTLRDGTARVEVHDRGAAIPEAELKKLFSPFVRLRSAHHQEGLGLGLYISREIVARHGGRTGVTSAEGTGSVFFFELPLLARAQAQAER